MKSLACGILLAAGAFAQNFPAAAALDTAIEQAIRDKQIPGAVLLVDHSGQVLYQKAYGNRAEAPSVERMTMDTMFDCASLTKVVATTSALMKLFEQGKLRLNDRVTEYLPEFQGGKSDITVRNLMTHFSGFRPDLDLEPAWTGYQTGIRRALIDQPAGPPGVRFVYSDINYILLGEIVERISGQTLPDYAQQTVFGPLGMRDTMFRPPEKLRARIAPTEILDKTGVPLRGVVHDPTARFMGGAAGHAGLFSTAGDLARFCRMLLGKGQWQGAQIFSPLTVVKFTTPESPPDQPILRGLGWDIDSPYSGERGDLFPIGSYGHTGFTGTSLWLDPASNTFVILLSNVVHPHPRPSLTSLRGRVATIVAGAVGIDVPGVSLTGYNETIGAAGLHRKVARNGQVRTGLDVWVEDGFRALTGKRVGLITNHTGIDREGRRNVDRMLDAGVRVVALYSPEHGFAGQEDREHIGDTTDAKTGIQVWSLYDKTRRPTPEMLRGIDAMVFDIQDVGARFYTYLSTMAYAMEEAAKAHIPFYVLDRPNPITGVHVEPPMLDRDKLSFVGYLPLPLRHGMTIGELARLCNAENHIGADLTVVHMKGWERGDWFDSSGLPWVNPSPNIRSLTAALLYPGVAMLEYSPNYSVGRGTDAPFEMVGADFMRGPELAAYLNQRWIPGVRFYPTRLQPSPSHAEDGMEGVRLVVTDRDALDASCLGIEIAAALLKLYPGKILLDANRSLIGNEETMRALAANEDPRLIRQKQQDALQPFLVLRERYLLYR